MKAKYQSLTYGTHFIHTFLEEKLEFDDLWHYHPDYELTYILKSKGTRYVGNSIENFKENDLVLIGPNVPHCWKTTPGQRVNSQAIVICWNENLLDEKFIGNKEFTAIHKLISFSNQGLRFNETIAWRLKRKFIELVNLPPFEKLIMLLQILNELSKSCEAQPLCDKQITMNRNSIDSERINKIYLYTKQHYSEKITLKDIASNVNMTEEYFSRFFSKTMKKTFFLFLNEYRINMACQLLLETDMQVTQIHYSTGFESNAHFYRQFKKFKGFSPLSYKAQYQKLSNQ